MNSAFNSTRTIAPCKTNGPCRDTDHHILEDIVVDDSSIEFLDNLRSSFYKLLSSFLKEFVNRACVHPVLAKLGDGRLVDLFNLYCIVRGRGGYETITEEGEWGSVTRESGFDDGAAASLKLMHFKYLSEFDLWLRGKCGDMFLGSETCEFGLNFAALALELEFGYRGLLSDRIGERHAKSNGKCVAENQKRSKLHDDDEGNDNDDKNCGSGDGIKIPETKYQKKRKRDSLKRMLSWVVDVAIHPDDPSIGTIPEPSKVREYPLGEVWVQAILARDALGRRCPFGSENQEHCPEKKLKMHPCMNVGNFSNNPYSERFRCKEKNLPTPVKNPTYGNRLYVVLALAVSKDFALKHSKGAKGQVMDDLNLSSSLLYDEHDENSSSVGPLFQAEVPEWTGMVSESDPKWLGTKFWPLAYNCSPEMGTLGKGRSDSSCSCLFPGLVECVRFHIAEKRLKLKLELGSVFYQWRFHHMGEEISFHWTVDEERRFKDAVRAHSRVQGKCFMNIAVRHFPKKRRESIVSYYWNAFRVQQRRYQNRVASEDINSDDDVSEFGSFGDAVQNKLAHVPKILPCVENRQCSVVDLDEGAVYEGFSIC